MMLVAVIVVIDVLVIFLQQFIGHDEGGMIILVRLGQS
jgi:hypothetical protein